MRPIHKLSLAGALAALGVLQGCGQGSGVELAPKNPMLTPAPAPAGVGVLFEDFEAATPAAPAYYGAGPVPSSGWSNTESVSPIHSMSIVTSSTGWGAGMNISSNYGVINAAGKTSFEYWIKSSLTATYTVRFSEAQTGIQNENWRSPDQNVTGGGGWQLVQIPIGSFVEDDYGDPACAGTCSSQGNGTKDLGAIDKFEIQFAAFGGSATVYIDDITFK